MSTAARRPLRSTCARLLVLGALCAGAFCSFPWLQRHVVFNFTKSLPRGLYLVNPEGIPEIGSLVMLRMPDEVIALAKKRGYLPPTIENTIKPIGAMVGDHVCLTDGLVLINGKSIVRVQKEDRHGRLLPELSLCRTLSAGEIFLVSREPRHFDSRYYGVVRVGDILGTISSFATEHLAFPTVRLPLAPELQLRS